MQINMGCINETMTPEVMAGVEAVYGIGGFCKRAIQTLGRSESVKRAGMEHDSEGYHIQPYLLTSDI